jgi:hypothetical protein
MIHNRAKDNTKGDFMNSIAQQEAGIVHETNAMRYQLMDMLTDADLAYALPGNSTFGELCWQIGAVQRTYIDSYKTFKLGFAYAPVDTAVAGSVERLKAWFKSLDEEMDAALAAISEEDAQNKMIDRGGGFALPLRAQIHVYREAQLIFYGRAILYLNALNKPATGQLRDWLG